MKRRDFLKAAGFAAVSAMTPGCMAQLGQGPSGNKVKPNIVFILSDDMGWGQLGYQGGKLIPTPNIDALAKGGVELNQFYVQPVCTPTRSAFLTGRYPFKTGTVMRFTKSDTAGMLLDERTMAEALKEAGYFTAMSGKWHLGEWQKAHLPNQRGFDYHYGHYSAAIDSFEHTRSGVLDWHRNGKAVEEEGYSTYLLAAEVEKLIAGHDTGKPFFFYIPFNAVHGPHQAPPEVIAKYKKKLAVKPGDKKLLRQAAQAAQLECMDIAVGRIVNAINKKGIRDNTLIMFVNDNGGPERVGNYPLRGHKGAYYEGGMRVPAVANWPGRIKAGTVVNEIMHISDLYPTFINLAGGSLKQKLPIDGMDVWETIAKGKPSPRDEIVHGLKCIRVGDWKYIDKDCRYYRWKAEVSQLYNIKDDPYEENNLIDKVPGIAQRLRKRLEYHATTIRLAEIHRPIPNYPPTVYGEEENKTYKKRCKRTKSG
ncbi:MAG: sulfatase-like hydrolase/transferase [Planctomycetota bacterium]|jgi:arylsulfatase A-like enzyme